ncbi:MAG: hypothetical protein FWC29_00525 [Methanomassiliicoccaceae archaeon]|nr:hypothetical protein [Methanomassiliicoccaceae archaeon]
MKKLILVLSLAIVFTAAIVCIVAFSAQNDHEDSEGDSSLLPLSAKMEMEIKKDFFNKYTASVPEMTIDDVEIYDYYGTYSGCVVLNIGSKFLGRITLWAEEIDGLWVPGLATAWKGGNFYNLHEAYNLCLLTKDDISEISSHFIRQ